MKNPTVSMSGIFSTKEWTLRGWMAEDMALSERVLDQGAELLLLVAELAQEVVVGGVAAASASGARGVPECRGGGAGRVAGRLRRGVLEGGRGLPGGRRERRGGTGERRRRAHGRAREGAGDGRGRRRGRRSGGQPDARPRGGSGRRSRHGCAAHRDG